MIYYELVEHSLSNRNKIIRATELSYDTRDHPAFISMFGFGDEIKKWVELNGSVKGYNGTFHLQNLYLDVDCDDDLEKAKRETIKIVRYLYKKYRVDPDSLVIYFSGRKGFHISMVDRLFGGFEPSSKLPSQTEKLVDTITPDGLDSLDMTIYNANRIFRLPNSVHDKTGLYKIPLSVKELKLPIEEIQEMAQKPRPNFKTALNYNDVVVNTRLKQAWNYAQSNAEHTDKSNASKDTLKSGDFFKPPASGERNNKLFKQSAMLFDKGLDAGDVFDIIKSINNSANPPIEDMRELYTIVKSAESKTGANKKKKVITGSQLISDLVPPFMGYLEPTRKKLGLLFDEFSADVRWKLRGKFIAVAGREGSKKSLFCQNMAYDNMRRFGTRSIISSMEMGANALMSRLVDRTFNKYDIRPSDDMERAMKEGKDKWVRQRLDVMSKHYGDKLIINSQSAMTPDDYRKLIEEEESKRGKVDFLFVDGFSMMGGGGSDRFQTQETNSRELKEIAKDYDVCVVGIFHTNASCEKHWRKPHEYIRGSNKQLDNVDAFVSLSQVVDGSKTKHENDVHYVSDKGYALFYNKRGSGREVRQIFDFHSPTLSMSANDADPNAFEVDIKKNKNF